MTWCKETFHKIFITASCIDLNFASIHEERMSHLGKLRGGQEGKGAEPRHSSAGLETSGLEGRRRGNPAPCWILVTSAECPESWHRPRGPHRDSEENASLDITCRELSTHLWGLHWWRELWPQRKAALRCEGPATDWTSASLQNSYTEALTPRMNVLGGGAFGMWSGLDEVVRVGSDNEISVFIRRGRYQGLPLSLCHVGTHGEGGRLQPERGPSSEPDRAGPQPQAFSFQNCERQTSVVQAVQATAFCYSHPS